ncbi:OmpA family protein [Gilvibacter sediminis]|uniref:OmpA family protein n=1 Tax=Gilvibacter sediminis TaxID=379071 RepID=UPI002350F424|nr:OmpA family protein [Gilvibacter sediminis]MDC7997546.1 OmpA family protein [Gilvibacter sediminis]
MKHKHLQLLCVSLVFLLIGPQLQAQTKRIKRPRGSIGVSSADRFVRESFDLYDKVYRYDGYLESGTSLSDDDINVLEAAIDDVDGLLLSAPNVIADLDGAGVIKQSKGVLQINKAKKALRYCAETIPKLLAGRKSGESEDSDDQEETTTSSDENTSGTQSDSGSADNDASTNASPPTINSKFDFVPGDQIIFEDDFSADFIGDFPSRWNTNGSGEVVTFGDDPTKWLELSSGFYTFYVPDVTELPEEYTIEFDVRTAGIDRKTSSSARFRVSVEEENSLKRTNNRVEVSLNYPQYVGNSAIIVSRIDGKDVINNSLNVELRKEQLEIHHYAIAVNKRRIRLWVNQKKLIDVPRALPEVSIMNGIKLNTSSFKDGKERFFITNFKVAKGGLDLRRTLMNDGQVSTSGILFDSGSATIKSQSYGIIKQISQVLLQDKNMKLKIVGHTDSDGNDDTNLSLSKQRAAAVKQALIDIYGIDGNRLSTDGKGEQDPIADNSTPEGKAKNRRVVFIKE